MPQVGWTASPSAQRRWIAVATARGRSSSVWLVVSPDGAFEGSFSARRRCVEWVASAVCRVGSGDREEDCGGGGGGSQRWQKQHRRRHGGQHEQADHPVEG